MEVNQQRIEDAIIAQVSEELVCVNSLRERVTNAVDERIGKHFREIADKQITAAVENAIREGFEHEYRKVTSYGKPSGAVTTISKELERYISGYWNERVDNSGKPTESSYSTTRAEWVMAGIVAKGFSESMKQHIVDLACPLKDSLRKNLNETVNNLLSEVFHVRSWGDQELRNPGRSCIDQPETAKKS